MIRSTSTIQIVWILFSLYKFLETFAGNLDEDARQRITDKGTMDSLFDKILVCAGRVDECEDCFKALESDAELNKYGRMEVSSIYSVIQDICRIAIAYYQFDPDKRCKFTYYKVLVNL
ncbi:MAG: hypothetical protein ACK5HT_07945 [Draconibacterium sp.]